MAILSSLMPIDASYPVGPVGPAFPEFNPYTPQPPIGYQPHPDIPIGAGICPTGTKCTGVTVQTPIGAACLGTCTEIQTPTLPMPDPSTPYVPPVDTPVGPSPGVCDLPTREFCKATCGFKNGGNGSSSCGCNGGGSCTLPNGRRGRTNKTGYFLKSGQYVAPGSKCVKPRRMNYANGSALKRSTRRLKGFNTMVKGMRKELRRLATI